MIRQCEALEAHDSAVKRLLNPEWDFGKALVSGEHNDYNPDGSEKEKPPDVEFPPLTDDERDKLLAALTEKLHSHEDYADRLIDEIKKHPDSEPQQKAFALEPLQLKVAPTYWVSHEMAQLVGHAAKSLPPESFMLDDMPTCSGFVSMATDTPIGPYFSCDQFSWSVAGPFCLVRLYDSSRPGIMRQAYIRVGDERMTGECDSMSKVFAYSFVRAFWIISQQTMARVSELKPDRASRRRLSRSGSSLADKTLKIVVLRRERMQHPGSSDESTEVEWTHRWMVNGHWRNQWLPSRGAHRQQFILPYVKGPEDKPLVLKRELRVLVR